MERGLGKRKQARIERRAAHRRDLYAAAGTDPQRQACAAWDDLRSTIAHQGGPADWQPVTEWLRDRVAATGDTPQQAAHGAWDDLRSAISRDGSPGDWPSVTEWLRQRAAEVRRRHL